jgi:hypothetical protein
VTRATSGYPRRLLRMCATAVLSAVALAACASLPAPRSHTERVLFRDLERQVTLAATTGWGVDRLEIEGMLETSLDAACRVEPQKRRSLAVWLDAELARLGGPVEKAWRERGKKLSKVDQLLVVTRIRMLLARAEASAHECPFWLAQEEPYTGRQISESLFQLSFGGGGKGIVLRQGGDTDLSGGGAGRVLFGRMFEGGHGLYAGIEAGASVFRPKTAAGDRPALELAIDVVFPVVVRRTFVSSYLELEAGYVTRTTERDWEAYDHGFHVGASFGARALRRLFVFPGLAFGVAYEQLLRSGDDLKMIKVGARVALDFDLW